MALETHVIKDNGSICSIPYVMGLVATNVIMLVQHVKSLIGQTLLLPVDLNLQNMDLGYVTKDVRSSYVLRHGNDISLSVKVASIFSD